MNLDDAELEITLMALRYLRVDASKEGGGVRASYGAEPLAVWAREKLDVVIGIVMQEQEDRSNGDV